MVFQDLHTDLLFTLAPLLHDHSVWLAFAITAKSWTSVRSRDCLWCALLGCTTVFLSWQLRIGCWAGNLLRALQLR